MRTSHSPADLTLSAYLASFAAGRRVLWVGEASADEQAPVAEQAARVEVRGGEELDDLPAGAFDLIVAPDVTAVGGDLQELLDRVARLVGDEGAAVLGWPVADGEATREAASSALGDRFDSVRFAGQAPFHAYAFAEMGAVPSDVLVDGTLVGDAPPAPQRLLALCAGNGAELEAYAVIRYPDGAVAEAPLPSEPGAGEPGDGEFTRLEEALADRARELRELKDELAHRDMLVRDLIDRVGGVGSGPPAGAETAAEPAAPHEAPGDGNGAALERALEAEAARAEAQFRIDELEARLAEAGAQARATREANLEGTVRGLRSRLAEEEEMRALAEGRLELARMDLESAAERERDLQRELGELREQFELELVRTRGAEFAHRDRLGQLQAEERRLAGRVEELQAECEGLRARLADREKAVEELRSAAEAAPDAGGADAPDAEAVAQERDRLREELEQAREARDGLVSRLQNDLAEEESRSRQEREQAERLQEENERLRDAMTQASGAVDERDDMRRRLETLEAAHARDVEAMRETRAILADAPGAEPGARERHEITAVGAEAPSGEGSDAGEAGRDQLRALQERLARLQEELEHERSARRAEAERVASASEPKEGEDEVRRLHGLLGDRDAEVELLKGKLHSQERDVQAMRQAIDEARTELEELLGAATESGDPAMAQRMGALLRLLGQL